MMSTDNVKWMISSFSQSVYSMMDVLGDFWGDRSYFIKPEDDTEKKLSWLG